MKAIFLILILTTSLKAQLLTDIDCSNGDCHATNATVTQTAGDANYTALWINSIMGDLRFFSPQGTVPRDSKIYLVNRNANRNLNINLTSTLSNANGGSIDLISDVFNIIQINSDGNFGKNGVNSSNLCAQSFKNGDFGVDGINYWNNRNSSLDDNKCEIEDMNYLDQQFSCPIGYTESLSGDLSVKRIEKKRKCVSLYNRSQCIQRTYDFTCKFAVVRRVCGNQNFSLTDHSDYYISPNPLITYDGNECTDLPNGFKRSGESMYTTFRITEKQKNSFASDELLCANLVDNRPRFTAYFNYNWMNNGVPQTDQVTTKPGLVGFNDGSVKRDFYWPLPDGAVDSRGNSISPTNMRVVVKSWVSNGFINIPTNDPRKSFSDCIGLNGSAPNDFQCNRTPGPQMTITYNLMDSYGALSNDLTFTLAEGRYGSFAHLLKRNRYGEWNYSFDIVWGYYPGYLRTGSHSHWGCGHTQGAAQYPGCDLYSISGGVYDYTMSLVYAAPYGYTLGLHVNGSFKFCPTTIMDSRLGAYLSECNINPPAGYQVIDGPWITTGQSGGVDYY